MTRTKTRSFAVAGFALLVFTNARLFGQASPAIYRDPTRSTAERVTDLLGRMTLEEKVAQLECAINRKSIGETPLKSFIEEDHLNLDLVAKTFEKGLGTFAFLDEFNGLSGDAHEGAQHRNMLQEWVLHNTRLGIPILFHGEALHGAVVRDATSFPQAVGLGSTWDPSLLERMFSTVALEERALGNTLVLGPVFDLSRDPRYGRVEEMYSEDPFLVAQLGMAAVRGLQGPEGSLDQHHVYATAKHFVHGQPENGTNGGPSDFSEHTMRSVFLYPFEKAVKEAHIEAVMPSYNETLGGIPSNANPWLLNRVLRGEWGFNGITISDYGAIEMLSATYGVAADKASAGVLAFKSGVDMELPNPSGFPGLIEAVQNGSLSQGELDQAVRRVLTAKFNAGLFEHPLVDIQKTAHDVGGADHANLARKVADEAIVLLKNQNNLLPLSADATRTIAVIGPNASKERLGDYSGMPAYYVTILEGIRKRVGKNTKVIYSEGCRISEPDSAANTNTYANYKAPDEHTDERLISDAVETARKADLVILALGGNEVVSREATGDSGLGYMILGDSDSIELPGRQNDLVARLAKLGKPTVAVLLNGKAYAVEQLSRQVPALVESWYLGQETGNAIAGVLFGDVNPSGHLPVTIARNVGQLPVFYYKTPNARTRYVFDDNMPLFPFGFGLNYTAFTFGQPVLDRGTIGTNETTKVSITVTNTGSRSGDEVVQMYVHHPISSFVQPVIALRGFKRIHLEPQQSTAVTFEVGPEQLSIINAEMHRLVEPGPVEIEIGPSSAELKKVQVVITGGGK
jgi:beta-glucosidase